MRYQAFFLLASISLLCNVQRADAQQASCLNFWVNPKTGQEECLNISKGSIGQDRIVRSITGRTTKIGTSKSPLKIVQKVIQPCQKACLPGINDLYIGVKIVNEGNTLRQVHAIEYNLILKEYNQVIETGFVANTGISTLRPGESAILVTSLSANVLPQGTKITDLDVIFLASVLDE